ASMRRVSLASGPSIAAVGRALPPHRVEQAELIAAFRRHFGERHFNPERLEQLHRAVGVGARYLALPIDEYPRLQSFAASNEAWTRVALDLAEASARAALDRAQLRPRDVDHVIFTTVTG